MSDFNLFEPRRRAGKRPLLSTGFPPITHTKNKTILVLFAWESELLLRAGVQASVKANKRVIVKDFSGQDRRKAAEVDPLRGDIEAYCAELDELLQHSAGKYVVFANGKRVKICESLSSALELGHGEFGRTPFLIQRVEPLATHADFHLACRG